MPDTTPTEVGEPMHESTHKVMAPIVAAEPRTVHGRHYLPRSIDIHWRCATHHGWRCGWASLYGPQIRKDGSLGTREIHEVIWMNADGTQRTLGGGSSDEPAPEWALAFYRESRPTWGPA